MIKLGIGLVVLGVSAILASIFLAFGFMVAGTPYVEPYTTVVWAIQIGGLASTLMGGLVVAINES